MDEENDYFAFAVAYWQKFLIKTPRVRARRNVHVIHVTKDDSGFMK